MAERQTRWLQVPVSERAWGFKSPLAHANENPGLKTGVLCIKPDSGLGPGSNQADAPRWEATNRRREFTRWLRIAAAAAGSSCSAIAA